MKADLYEIRNYEDFVNILLKAGFSMGGGNNEGIFAAIPWNWNEKPPYDTPVRWHTEDRETDPWEWRMRVLDERKDIAYAKVFFKKSGYITKEWYPYFLAARRGNQLFEEEYAYGTISNAAKRIYEAIEEYGTLPVHGIKVIAGFSKEDKSLFDRALIELQMKMYITMCGRQQKLSGKGEEYGWSSTVFCKTEDFFGESVFKLAAGLTQEEAAEALTEQIYSLNPDAQNKKIMKFIKG
ncbi:MAG: AlkZ-related protein [Lachnospiraceae bacterium]